MAFPLQRPSTTSLPPRTSLRYTPALAYPTAALRATPCTTLCPVTTHPCLGQSPTEQPPATPRPGQPTAAVIETSRTRPASKEHVTCCWRTESRVAQKRDSDAS